jgi:hypothetical protein
VFDHCAVSPTEEHLLTAFPVSAACAMLPDMERELCQRENDGISVTLLWDNESDRLTVIVRDWHRGETFGLDAQASDAMEVFHHPYAYLASQGRAQQGQAVSTGSSRSS